MQLAAAQLSATTCSKGLQKPLHRCMATSRCWCRRRGDAIRAAARAPGLHRAHVAHRGRRALRLERGAGRRRLAEPVCRQADRRDPHPLRQARQGRQRRPCSSWPKQRARQRQHADPGACCPGWTRRPQPAPGLRALESAASRCRSSRWSAPPCRSGLPSAWRAQGQRVAAGEEGQRTLQFFADRVEGNLLAAHQEIQKLALLYPGRAS